MQWTKGQEFLGYLFQSPGELLFDIPKALNRPVIECYITACLRISILPDTCLLQCRFYQAEDYSSCVKCWQHSFGTFHPMCALQWVRFHFWCLLTTFQPHYYSPSPSAPHLNQLINSLGAPSFGTAGNSGQTSLSTCEGTLTSPLRSNHHKKSCQSDLPALSDL